MRRVFFENKIIIFTDSPHDQADFTFDSHSRIDTAKVLQKLENSKQVVIKADDLEHTYSEFCTFFNSAEAAGGLVENSKGEWLMIYRNDRWDLPKGHVESYESAAECAVREIGEECGVAGLEIEQKLVVTEHIYKWNTKWVLKYTHWYKMSISPQGEATTPVPQAEERILKAEWIGRDRLNECLATSYHTIVEVFKIAGIL